MPNYFSEVLYTSYFIKLIDTEEKYKVETEKITQALKSFSKDGEIEPITKVISNFLTYQSGRDRENIKKYVIIFEGFDKYHVTEIEE